MDVLDILVWWDSIDGVKWGVSQILKTRGLMSDGGGGGDVDEKA